VHDLDTVAARTTYYDRSKVPVTTAAPGEITTITTTRSECVPVIGDRWTPADIYSLLRRVLFVSHRRDDSGWSGMPRLQSWSSYGTTDD
jgi:hypothetical protein